MADFTTADIRNVAITGHAGSGKTSLVEQILHAAGVIGRAGTIEEGSTVTDFEPEEKEHQHSLSSALVQMTLEGKRLNFIDTPGYPDFLAHAITVLPAVETVAVVIDPAKGVQMVTRRIMKLSEDNQFPRMLIINKIDSEDIDLEGLVATLKESFGNACVPVSLPKDGGAAVVDCIKETDGEADFSSVADAHSAILDQVVEVDDALMEAYLETGEAPSPEKFRDAFRKALREGHLIPICFASSRTGAGVKELLALVTELCPSPLEGNPRPFIMGGKEGETAWTPEADPQKPLCAHVFKVTTDKFVGKLAYFRVHQGTMKSSTQVFRNDERKGIRIGHAAHVLGKDQKDVQEIIAGDLGSVAKIAELQLNDVLHEGGDLAGLKIKPLPLPRPMYGLAIKPKTRQDETKVGPAMQKIMEEDPTFKVERVAATNQTVARGTGVLHMRVILEKLKNRFQTEVDTDTPKVPYLETIAGKAEGHHRHKKQTGGAGQFGEVYMRIEPLPRDHEDGFEYHDDTFGGSIPKQFMPAIEKGVHQAMDSGIVAGYPFTGVKVSVYDGKHHPVDSKEVAFVTAGKRAFIKAVQAARPILLEPWVDMEITIPADNMGDINSDMSGRRGRVQGTEMLPGGMCTISAIAPLAEVQTYANNLKSMTGGRGSYSMDFSHYEQVPPQIQADIVAAFKPHEDED